MNGKLIKNSQPFPKRMSVKRRGDFWTHTVQLPYIMHNMTRLFV